jgi:THO complex subunit 2
MDADFASQFIKVLHNLGTKGFWTIRCYEQIFGTQLGSVIFSCTQNEARNYGE